MQKATPSPLPGLLGKRYLLAPRARNPKFLKLYLKNFLKGSLLGFLLSLGLANHVLPRDSMVDGTS
jgi:hypothetical protein